MIFYALCTSEDVAANRGNKKPVTLSHDAVLDRQYNFCQTFIAAAEGIARQQKLTPKLGHIHPGYCRRQYPLFRARDEAVPLRPLGFTAGHVDAFPTLHGCAEAGDAGEK